MESKSIKPESLVGSDHAVGRLFSDGVERYLLEAGSTSGYTAWKMADGTILISEAMQVSIPAGPSVNFWACAGYQDTTPSGYIKTFDCHGCGLTRVDVTELISLEYLDCSFNRLTELNLAGLRALQGLDVEGNQLERLVVRDLPSLRMINCASNWLTELDLTGLSALRVVDCSKNQITHVRRQGCPFLGDLKF